MPHHLLPTLLFASLASLATASTTRITIWSVAGGQPEGSIEPETASVVSANPSQTTLSISVPYVEPSDSYTALITAMGPNSYQQAAIKPGVTEQIYCSRASSGASATCSYSVWGPSLLSALCKDLCTYVGSTSLYVVTETLTGTSQGEGGKPFTTTLVSTVSPGQCSESDVPDYCRDGATKVPDDVAKGRSVVPADWIVEYPVVVTAGAEKLSASAGGSVKPNEASATATGTGSASGNGSGSGSGTAANAPSGTGAAAVVTPAAMLGFVAAAAAML